METSPHSGRTVPSTTSVSFEGVEGYELFAVLDGTDCAETLVYGPSPITTDGSADGYSAYLSTRTPNNHLPHNEWLQIVTSDGDTELFRIQWHFLMTRTLEEGFMEATEIGASVAHDIIYADPAKATISTGYGNWWFNNYVATRTYGFINRFEASTSTANFSLAGGMWGASDGYMDGHTNMFNFTGVGNLDGYNCSTVFEQGVPQDYPETKTYMYFSKQTAAPTQAPTFTATLSPTTISTAVPTSAAPSVPPTTSPTSPQPTVAPTVTSLAVSDKTASGMSVPAAVGLTAGACALLAAVVCLCVCLWKRSTNVSTSKVHVVSAEYLQSVEAHKISAKKALKYASATAVVVPTVTNV